jgi:hypothetical protein
MYGLVNYQLTGIQKGIQFGHAVVEYGQMSKKIGGDTLKNYDNWADNHKTFIILNGGTTNKKTSLEDGLPFGTLNNHLLTLNQNNIELSFFEEPDLGDQLTCISFIVDERVFNKKDYPDFGDWIIEKYGYDYLNIDTSSYITSEEVGNIIKNSSSKGDKEIYQKWLKLIGGEKNLFLRDFLKKFKLA